MILLDTCTLLWLTSDQRRLSTTARALITRHAGALFVSSVSAFEIGVSHRKRRLELPLPPEEWFPFAMEDHGLEVIPVDADIALASTQLPMLHADLGDRFIVATALSRDFTVLTPDPLIRAYAVRTAW